MSKIELYKLILDEWIASFNSRDKKKASIRNNFEDLFQKWADAGASRDDLYTTLLSSAIETHYPNDNIAHSCYLKFKKQPGFAKNEKSFITEWRKSIKDTATEAFFEYFPVTIQSDSGPKVFGSMSAKEYRAQRAHAESFTLLDTTELEKQWLQDTQDINFNDMFENVLGEKDETNS